MREDILNYIESISEHIKLLNLLFSLITDDYTCNKVQTL